MDTRPQFLAVAALILAASPLFGGPTLSFEQVVDALASGEAPQKSPAFGQVLDSLVGGKTAPDTTSATAAATPRRSALTPATTDHLNPLVYVFGFGLLSGVVLLIANSFGLACASNGSRNGRSSSYRAVSIIDTGSTTIINDGYDVVSMSTADLSKLLHGRKLLP